MVVTLMMTAVLISAPSGKLAAATYSQDFNAYADGSTELSDGSSVVSNNGVNQVIDSSLQMTVSGTGQTSAAYHVPALANSSQGWSITFDFTISYDGVSSLGPADGFAFSYGNMSFGQLSSVNAEEGWGNAVNHISFEVDTYNYSADAGDAGLGIGGDAVGASGYAFTPAHGVDANVSPTIALVTASVIISWDPVNGASFSTNGLNTNANFSNVATPGFTGNDAFTFAFGARTGGATETVKIDNVVISSVPEPASTALLGLGGLALMLRRRRLNECQKLNECQMNECQTPTQDP